MARASCSRIASLVIIAAILALSSAQIAAAQTYEDHTDKNSTQEADPAGLDDLAISPPAQSWVLKPGYRYVLFYAQWEQPADEARLTIIRPDGTRIQEDAFFPNKLTIVEELSGAAQRVVAALQPEGGEWRVELAGVTNLTGLQFFAESAGWPPEFKFLAPPVLSGDQVIVSYEAFDRDSEAEISFWLTDDPLGNGGSHIANATELDGKGAIALDTSRLAPDDYYVRAIMNDRHGPARGFVSDSSVFAGREADLAAKFSATAQEVAGGESVSYTATISNLSDTEARNLRIVIQLPRHVEIQRVSPEPVGRRDWELIFEKPTLAGLSSEQIHLTIRTPVVKEIDYFFSLGVEVDSETYDPSGLNESDIVSIALTPPQ